MTPAQLRARECVIALREDRKANLFRGILDSIDDGGRPTDFAPTNDAAVVAIIERAIAAAVRDERMADVKAHR